MIDSGAKDMMPHFIYCYYYFFAFEKLKEIILGKMQKYGIQASILTMLYMQRSRLITKEKSKQAAEGKLKNDPEWEHYEGSIMDDLESFVNNLQITEETGNEEVKSFFTPKLSKKELKLVAQKNEEHMKTYFYLSGADVGDEEMKKSDSKDKYVQYTCHRKTVHLTLESNL